MTFFKIKYLKTIAAIGTMVFFGSCSNDTVTSTGGLVDNESFQRITLNSTTDKNLLPDITTSDVDFTPSNLLSTYLIGDYTNPTFGTLNAGFVGQVISANSEIVNSNIDDYPVKRSQSNTPSSVITTNVAAFLEIPLSVSRNNDTGNFELDNIIGDINTDFSFKVLTFSTFLERLNTDGVFRIYYSNGTNDAGSKEILKNQEVIGELSSYKFESSYTTDDNTLKIPLNADYIKTNILDKLDSKSVNEHDDLKELFKGIKLEVSKTSGNGLIVPVDLTEARLKITYNNQITGEAVTDEEIILSLNTNTGTNDAVLYGTYLHDHNRINTPKEVYVQGASGYNAKVDLSNLIDAYSATSIEENWLINQATLKIYVKEEADGDYTNTIDNLYIYAVDDSGDIEPIDDYTFLGGNSFVDGVVKFEDAENKKAPFVRFFITEFIKQALADGKISTLMIKERRATNSETAIVDLRSTNAKGIILLNDRESTTKAPEFELIYSEIPQ